MIRFSELYNVLAQLRGIVAAEDNMVWKGDSKGIFSVKSAYKEYNISNNQVGCCPWKMIWKAKIPHKVACFTWLLAQEVVLTHDNLVKRGYQLTSRRYLCGEEEETINHLFLHCNWTEALENFHQPKGNQMGDAWKNS